MPPQLLNLNFEEMEKAGLPVKRGVRQFHSEDKKDVRAVASDMWVHRWAKHAAINYPIVSKALGVKDFEDCATGLPVFCVGIGPSLDDNISDLKTARGRALIFSTDAALKPLLAHDIIPHVVMTFDCGEHQKTLFETVPKTFHDDMFLFANSCTHPDTIQAWSGPKAFFNQYHQRDEFIAKLLPYIYPNVGQLPSAGTVGNMLVILSWFFGCTKIHLVGMDLSYKQVGETWQYRCTDYAMDRGWVPKENRLLYDNDLRLAKMFEEEIDGEKFKVDPELKMYRESLVGICNHFRIAPINCSEGVLNKFFEHRSIGDSIMLNCRSEIPKHRTILTNAREFFSGNKIHFDHTFGPVHKTLSEAPKEAVPCGSGTKDW